LPALATLRGIHGGYEQRDLATPIALTFGLYQGHKLTAASVESYYRALDGILLPRLLSRLETEMQASLDKPDVLYEALKVYLILGRQGPLDRGLVMQWMGADFASAFPGDDGAPVRDALLAHIKAMLERPLTAIPLNGPLVEQVRAILNKEPLAEYSYNRIMRSPRIRSLPEWTVADNGGPAAGRVFELRSGKPLSTGVPGIFTWAGYHTVFLPLLPTVTQDIAEDGWVLGEKRGGGVGGTIAKTNQLRRDVLGLYLDDYTRRWDAMLADIAIKPFGNLQAGLDELNLLAAPDSPLRDLLQSVDSQTQLSHPAATDQAASQAEAKAAKVGQKAAGFAAVQARAGLDFQSNTLVSILGEAFGPGPNGSKPVDPAVRVDEHFRAIHDFVAGGDQKQSPMEAAIQKIQAIYQSFNQVANAPNQGQALLGVVAGGGAAGGGGGGSAAAQLQALSKDLPKPIAAMLQTVSLSSSAVTASGASQELADAWKSKVLPLCQAAFGRYPFVAGSAADVPPDDFAHLLGPGGMIDQFFDQNLKPFVDTDATPWRWQAGEGAKLALSPGALAQFQRAAMIRDGLFPAGGQQMVVHFQLVPAALDPQLAQVTLDIAGQTLTYSHGPTESHSFTWPGPGGKTLVRLTMTPASGDQGRGGTVVEKDGPWALLRLLDTGKVIPSGQPDKFRLVFTSPAGSATFDLNASSVRNPFTLSALRSFRCPARL
ncbi:MAG: type VI secretion system membrane subunit TssM, partial [Acetobacteraceae bacterium]|nr:type VI secretion system membrane subunit TssM [Acetobacteraceae bacterium]